MFLSKRSNRCYYLWYVDELGHKRKVSTKCRQKADALRFLQSFKRQEHERKQNLSRVSLAEFTAKYLEYSKGVHTRSTNETNQASLNEFKRLIGDLPLHKIGVREIEAFLAEKRREASVWTARCYFTSLAAAFETAKRWGNVLENPFRLVAKPKTPELQPVFFTRSDFSALLKVIEDRDFRELVIAAISTGMRQGELLALRWDWIDFSRKVLTVKNTDDFLTKNRRSRVIPMTETLCKLLKGRKRNAVSETALVFHKNGKKLSRDFVSKTFKRYVVSAGVDNRLHYHSLRHSFASWLAIDGVSLYAIQKLLGHSSSNVTQIYSHLAPEQLHATVDRLGVALN